MNERILPLKYYGYNIVAKSHNSRIENIEKDIQNAISSAFLKGDIDSQQSLFGNTLDEDKGKPTNKQFILTSIEHLKNCN